MSAGKGNLKKCGRKKEGTKMGWSFGGVFAFFLGKAMLCASENPSKGWVLAVVFGQGSTTHSDNAVRCNSIRSLFCLNQGSCAAFRWVTIN